jgi:hypothetical protein
LNYIRTMIWHSFTFTFTFARLAGNLGSIFAHRDASGRIGAHRDTPTLETLLGRVSSAKAAEKLLQIRRQRSLEAQPLAGARMSKLDFRRV